MEKAMNIETSEIDWVELREQKQTLLKQIDKARDDNDEKTTSDLVGILGLLDYIQDEASNELGEDEVFGKEEE
jgi:uncharacterized protein YpiB (UPF0302 family)